MAAKFAEILAAQPRRKYHVGRALQAIADGREPKGLEGEVHAELAAQCPSTKGGTLFPLEALVPSAALDTETQGAGAELVYASPRYTEALHEFSVAFALGATPVDEPVPAIARATEPPEILWPGQSGAELDETAMSFELERTNPKLAMAVLPASIQLLRQAAPGGGGEVLVRRELRRAYASAVDGAVFAGLGPDEDQPLGLLRRDDIPTIPLGTDGAAVTWEDLVALQEAVTLAEGDGALTGYAATPQVRSQLQTTERFAGAGPIWDGGAIDGRRARASVHLPRDLEKGSGTGLHSLVYGGDWSTLMIVSAPAVEILSDRFTHAGKGITRLILFAHLDVAVGQPDTFAALKDVVVQAGS